MTAILLDRPQNTVVCTLFFDKLKAKSLQTAPIPPISEGGNSADTKATFKLLCKTKMPLLLEIYFLPITAKQKKLNRINLYIIALKKVAQISEFQRPSPS